MLSPPAAHGAWSLWGPWLEELIDNDNLLKDLIRSLVVLCWGLGGDAYEALSCSVQLPREPSMESDAIQPIATAPPTYFTVAAII